MRTVLCGNLLVEILPGAGNRLHRPSRGTQAPRFRWRSPTSEGPQRPALGRDHELQLIRAAITDGRPIEFHASCGYGVSTLLRAAAGGGHRPPYVYLRAGPGGIEDLAQRLVAAMYAPDRPAVPTSYECLQLLGQARAVVVLDDFLAGADHLSYLRRVLPGCSLVIGSPRPVLRHPDASHKLRGLTEAAARELVGSELRRTLTPAEHEALTRLIAAVDGQPLHLRQAAALVRSGEHSFAALAARAERDPGALDQLSLATLSDNQRRALAVLALAAGAFLPIDLVRTMGDIAQIGESLAALRERGLADQRGDRFGLPICRIGPYRRSLLGYIHLAAATRELADWFTLNDPTSAESLSAVNGAIGVLGFAAESGRWETVALLARLIEPTLTLAGRWQACHAVLAHGLGAAKALGDRASEAYFSHQRGTLEFCRDELQAARGSLEYALRLRELAGDSRGTAVTRHNLELLLPPVPPPPPPSRKRPQRHLLAAAAVALSVLAAAAGIVTMAVEANHATRHARPVAAGTAHATSTSPRTSSSPRTSTSTSTVPSSNSSDNDTATPLPATIRPTSPSPRLPIPLSPDPGQVDFGSLDISPGTAASPKTLTLTNPNDRAVTIPTATMAGSTAYTLTGTDCTLRPIAPHSTCTVDLQFSPQGVGPAVGKVILTQAQEGVLTIPLTGTGSVELKLTIAIRTSNAPISASSVTVQDDQGLLTCHSSCNIDVTSQNQVNLTLTATPSGTPSQSPAPLFVFTGWSGACTGGPSQPQCTIKMTQDTNVTATFVQY
jgi:hypothetical protein